jgi:hypothetical protein
VLDPGRRKTKTGYFRAIIADDQGHGGARPLVVMVHYPPGRGAVHALQFLKGYRGSLVQCGVCEAYDKLTGVDCPERPWTLGHCWSHAHRRFVKQLEKDGSPIAEAALRQIAKLYVIEKSLRGLPAEHRLAVRKERSAPLIAAFKPWLEAQLSRIPRSSKLAEDIRYTRALARPDPVPGGWPARAQHQPGRKTDRKNRPDVQERSLRRTRDRRQDLGHARQSHRQLQDVRR